MSKRTAFEFCKSSYSGAQGECVEVALNVSSVAAVRDSKRPSGPVVTLEATAWHSFVEELKARPY